MAPGRWPAEWNAVNIEIQSSFDEMTVMEDVTRSPVHPQQITPE
ncbi:hypothetical protein M7I_1691 [Glarea lozoyensis 74030]|uniref:Uncharacterized protein n=1 Tax=Glarea lozoyensis (strain ATCC 74030 / MF5533) TaxID=1104152 RepID=H0EGS2_GLAL7|nr:hypothetical protein M7I_1691 [Glarea lozoyensis 74030]